LHQARNRQPLADEEVLVTRSGPSALGSRLAAHEPDALRDCYAALGPMVLGYLRRLVPASDAEDVLQRVFVEVWRSKDRYDPDRSLEAWVLGIARKRAIDQLRRGHSDVVPLDRLRDVAGEDGRVLLDRYASAARVRAALTMLPTEQREVLVLAYFGGHTQPEIATRLGVPLGTVKARAFRGLRRLAGLLAEEPGT
jgi:RNA polymerase sigma factor (sigma-70 family)